MAKTQIHLLIRQTMDRYGIVGKELAKVAGIGASHISDIRTGRKWASEEVFAAILEGMEQIAPGSKVYFCQLLAGQPIQANQVHKPSKEVLVSMIKCADDEELEAILPAIGQRWKELRNARNLTESAVLCDRSIILSVH